MRMGHPELPFPARSAGGIDRGVLQEEKGIGDLSPLAGLDQSLLEVPGPEVVHLPQIEGPAGLHQMWMAFPSRSHTASARASERVGWGRIAWPQASAVASSPRARTAWEITSLAPGPRRCTPSTWP